MTRRYDDEDDDDLFDENGLLKDGKTYRVPMMLRDNLTFWQRSVRDSVLTRQCDWLLVTDAAGGSEGLHRPGFRFIADAADRKRSIAAREAAYRAADEADANAWRCNAVHPESADNRTLDQITADRLSLLDERELAYLEVEERDRNAWRSPR
jgi:hypothetical protein